MSRAASVYSNLFAERSLMGCCLLSPRVTIPFVVSELTEDDFMDTMSAELFRRISKDPQAVIDDEGGAALTMDICGSGTAGFDAVGVWSELCRMQEQACMCTEVPYMIEAVKEASRARALKQLAAETVSEMDHGEGPSVQVAHAKATIARLERPPARPLISFGDAAAEALREGRDSEDPAKRRAEVTFGWPTLDAHRGGIFPGELVILAAETGHGKTAAGLGVAMRNARLRPADRWIV